MNPWLPAALALWRREIVRFFRQRGRVIGAIGTPLMFWAVFGFGFFESFRAEGTAAGGVGYQAWSLPGIVAMTLLFTAVFSGFSLIEDRKEGFLQGVLVAPVSPAAMVVGKLLGGATVAVAQGLLILALAPLVGIPLDASRLTATFCVMALTALGLTGLGFAAAWRSGSIQGFHGVMNLLLMPMWLLSGAVFPASGAHGAVRAIMAANPMTYGVAALRRVMWPESVGPDAPGLVLALSVTAAFAALTFVLSLAAARRPTAGDLH
ncbi:MAG TPA: ABC transporter permease [Planctomycetota bacterium]|nr:ABC transporter permease [Planctomycetota bacterium]